MEQTQEQNKSLAQQLVDEYYGNYKKTKPSEAELPSILSIIEFMLDKYHLGISIEPLKMTAERIKEIQLNTGYPDSVSVQQALLQVWNEVAQESNQVQAVVMQANVCEKCDHCGGEKTYANQVCMPLNGKVRCIDWCIHQIVAALNAGGVETTACCCGHNQTKGRIDLADGRILWIEKPA